MAFNRAFRLRSTPCNITNQLIERSRNELLIGRFDFAQRPTIKKIIYSGIRK